MLSLARSSALILVIRNGAAWKVGIIVAGLGKQQAVFSDTTYAIIMAISLLTLIIEPPASEGIIRWLASQEDALHAIIKIKREKNNTRYEKATSPHSSRLDF